jgi:hypothetical protein
MALFSSFLTTLVARLPVMSKLVAVPPDRVDAPYDSSPLVPGEDYIRLWLTEVQHVAHRDSKERRYILISRAEFQYGGKAVAIPAFLGPSSFGTPGTTGRDPITRALTGFLSLSSMMGGEKLWTRGGRATPCSCMML